MNAGKIKISLVALAGFCVLVLVARHFFFADKPIDRVEPHDEVVHPLDKPAVVEVAAPIETPVAESLVDPVPQHDATPGADLVPFRERADDALSRTNVIERSMQFGRVMREWVVTDPDGAADYLRGMPRGNEFVSGLLTLVQSIAQTNPEHAVDLAIELAVHPEERHVFNVLFDQIAQTDIRLAASLLDRLPTAGTLDNSVRAIASRWVDADEEAALAWATRLREPTKKAAAMEAVLFPLVSSDPWRALSIAARHLKGDALERTITRFLAEVTVESPGSAEDVLNFLPHGETKSHAIYGIARELAAENPAMAASWARQIEEDHLRGTAMRNVIEKWYAQDPDGARAYVSGSMTGSEQRVAVARIAEFWGASDPVAAAGWARSLPDREARDAAVVHLVSGWARKDPTAATQWALTLPESEQSRTEAIDGALSFWALLDGSAAASYAEQLPAGVNRDICLDALASLLAVSEPDRAAALALQIAGPDLREAAVRNLVEIFRYQDPARADELLQRSGF